MTEYILQLRDNKDSWTFTDDYGRVTTYLTKEFALHKAAELLLHAKNVVSVEIVRVQKTTVMEILSKTDDSQ